MKKLFLALTAASALAAAAAPAAAQPYGGYDRYDQYERDYRYDRDGRYDRYDRYGQYRYRYDSSARARYLMQRIDHAEDFGALSPGAAYALRRQVQAVDRLSWQYRRDGMLTQWERRDIDQRFDRLAWRIDRGHRYGYGYGYDYRR